jgi:hypothetical protein
MVLISVGSLKNGEKIGNGCKVKRAYWETSISVPNSANKSNIRFVKNRAFPKTRLVSGQALEKTAQSPFFPLNLRLLSQKLKFWESLNIYKFH